MQIDFIQIKNYKGFRDSGRVSIGPRFTVLTGQDNSGKTAFLEALMPGNLAPKPHREFERVNDPLPPVVNPLPSVTFGISISGPELRWFLLFSGGQMQVPVVGHSIEQVRPQIEKLFADDRCRFEITFTVNHGWRSDLPGLGATEIAKVLSIGRASVYRALGAGQ